MPRIRTFKPDMAASASLARLPREVLFTWQQLWPQCDDRGRFYGDPRLIWAAIYPLRDDVSAIELLGELEMLQAAGRVCCYRGCDGKVWLHVLGWDEHQKIDNPSKTRIPPCRHHDATADCFFHGKTGCESELAQFIDAQPVSSEDLKRRAGDASAAPLERPRDARAASPSETLARSAEGVSLGSRTVDLGPRTVDQGLTAPRSAAPDDNQTLPVTIADAATTVSTQSPAKRRGTR